MSTFTTQNVTFGATAETLILDCEDGRPTSITSVTVYQAGSDDTGQAESATTGSAAVETNPNTTISAVAGPGNASDPTALTVTSATGVTIGRTYRLTDDDTGVYEDVTVKSVNGTAVKLTRPLRNDYSVSATFVSCRSTIAVSSTWAADTGNLSPGYDPNPSYRAKWVVVIGGVTKTYVRYFDLVRYPARHGVTPVDVDERFPGWLDSLPPDYQADQGRALIDRAFRVVRLDLYQDAKADQAMRNAEAIAELVITRAMLLKLDDDVLRGAEDGGRIDRAKEIYSQRYNSLIRSPVMPMDESGGGASQPVKPRPVWSR